MHLMNKEWAVLYKVGDADVPATYEELNLEVLRPISEDFENLM